MAKSDFSEKDKLKCLLWCDRHCCLCGKPTGFNIEIAHIRPKMGNSKELDNIDNAIPLCYYCHGEIGRYNDKHPRGDKYREKELKTRREQIYEKYTRQLVPPLKYQITQECNQSPRQLPDVGFLLAHKGNELPIKVLAALEIFLDRKSLGLAETQNGLYSGRTFWNLNPGEGVNGHFPIPNAAVDSNKLLEIRINIKIIDIYEREHYLLPVGYIYLRGENKWFLEPGENLYSGKKYEFKGWRRFGIY